ncbi:MAG: biotin carboxylase N-terminal domain-containing protein [Sandaracinaceae bacterium]
MREGTASDLEERMFSNTFMRRSPVPPWNTDGAPERALSRPGRGYLGVREVLGTALGVPHCRLIDLASLPQGADGHRLVALRYFIDNGDIWLQHFAWRSALAKLAEGTGRDLVTEALALGQRVEELRGRTSAPDEAWLASLLREDGPLASAIDAPELLEALVVLGASPDARARLRESLRERASTLSPSLRDRLYLASMELTGYPATTVSAGELRYVLVADKGEMGVRAVREAVALGLVPVVLHSVRDDGSALQVRLAQKHGGFAIGLEGSFRESYANYVQITARVHAVFRERFGEHWQDELARAALYPGYGPLAENAAAIRHFRRHGIAFVGPMQDVVEHAGDKRRFRALVESIDPSAVTPGIVIADGDAAHIRARVLEAHEAGAFAFPGRLKAANGGGGRGQAIVSGLGSLDAAITKVLGEIESNAWDPGVMFEQNIAETVHLEVQVLRDRYGNTRHFGMRDCTEQRASQKIQEEAPPALLRSSPERRERIEHIAVSIAERVGYVGAGTVELMWADGKVYFLEMNTRIQVEHPVTEATHGIRRPSGVIEPLNLVRLQLAIADGAPIDFAQADVVQTHVGRELRINAESWHASIKDPRDGQRGLFVPNAGIFDRIALPDAAEVMRALGDRDGLEDVTIRFDVGFEKGDVLVNKDPTFGKLIVAVRAGGDAYELLRLATLEVLERIVIEGRQVRPDGRVIAGSRFETNLAAHAWILEHDVLRRHVGGDERGRHVGWVVDALRADALSAG